MLFSPMSHRNRKEVVVGRPAKMTRTVEQSTDLARAISGARDMVYGACWKLIRAQDIVINEKETWSHLQQVTQSLRNYADEEIAQIK